MIHFPSGSFKRLTGCCCYQEASILLLSGFLECSHHMIAGFYQRKHPRQESRSRKAFFYDLASGVTHHYVIVYWAHGISLDSVWEGSIQVCIRKVKMTGDHTETWQPPRVSVFCNHKNPVGTPDELEKVQTAF